MYPEGEGASRDRLTSFTLQLLVSQRCDEAFILIDPGVDYKCMLDSHSFFLLFSENKSKDLHLPEVTSSLSHSVFNIHRNQFHL